MSGQDAMEIDEDLQSRQMAVYGRAAMLKMSQSRVLISGLNGVGAETAKNVILANVREVVLHDERDVLVTHADLGGNFYLQEKDVGKHRATSCRAAFQELNPTCKVTASADPLTAETVQKGAFDVVVMCAGSLAHAQEIDAACRETVLTAQKQQTTVVGDKVTAGTYGNTTTQWTPSTCFIYAVAHGLLGGIFCDFGPTFFVSDTTGEQTKTGIVRNITKGAAGEKSKVEFVVEEDIDFDEGEYAEFTELEGLEALNSTPAAPRSVKLEEVFLGRRLVMVGDLSDLPGTYSAGGILTQRKNAKRLTFRSLNECIANPGELMDMDPSKQSPKAKAFDESVLGLLGQPTFNLKHGRSGLLFLLLRAVDQVGSAAAGSEDYPDKVLAAAQEINAATPEDLRVEELDGVRIESLRRLARGAGAVLNPIACIVGGIAGQEVVKACTFKFHPTHQWFLFDAEECLPETLPPAMPPAGTRYDSQMQVFGRDFQDALGALRLFLVGSGALGCEFLKNFALMGCSTEGRGQVTVTDDDIIEKSNLSRQFLFRNHNVGKSKSASAAEAVRVMNPAIRVKAQQDRVAPNTEDIFNDDFWLETDIVTNALDNVKARLYVDCKCVFFGKPLIESGTLGPKCNQQSVIPHFTENYGAQKDPEEKTAPMCALHNFPHNIDMCLGLARSEFIGNFETLSADANDFIKQGGAAWIEGLEKAGENKMTIKDKLVGDPKINCAMPGGLADALVAERPQSFADCVGWARRKYESYFVDRIRLLTFNFPEDETTESGKPFWSPPKRFPHPVPFDTKDDNAMKFVIAASNLRAKLFGLAEEHRDPAFFVPILEKVQVPEFKLFKAKLMSGEGEEGEQEAASSSPKEGAGDVDEEIRAAEQQISKALAAAPLKAPLFQNEFEKDDDTNFHIQFIQCFANLRAANYGIPPVDFLQAKLKAGRIIPAIATATAVATGFVCLELYKVAGKLPNSAYRNMFTNLAIPLFTQSEPQPAEKVTSGSRWDPESYMDVDEIAVPDPQTIWDSIVVPSAAGMTPNGLRAWLKEHHGVEMTAYAMSYPDPDKPGSEKMDPTVLNGKDDTPWAQILAEKGKDVKGRKLLEIHNGSSLVLEGTKDDSDCKLARIVLQVA
eukprot:TRINITY_DN1705_c0_g1_i1.p1 TRINITY_DN1705_c0_g1~~TRINITY_DN1705_c0_g1_i1.p1  ORF type:complete len:1124 (+),score=486.93 TRINITY_DN1705_c0_g1_i1:120-3491(+)